MRCEGEGPDSEIHVFLQRNQHRFRVNITDVCFSIPEIPCHKVHAL
ncbi:hypothetical protein TcasGA2_TC031471 [Tribolium castaneum]|uniref:Uncharacterized protein n=1 Tax=Tribolium castaneum TaxID=7070 RepID=A0A139WM39_TRICA|nr:hypothetical protein TcasGA2_TC031471 [Tribolium castaneum]